jgi:hypothetical protein
MPRMLILVFGLVGLLMGGVAIFVVQNTVRFRLTAHEVMGEVIGHDSHRGSKGRTMYSPRVRYVVPAPEGGPGATFEVVGGVSSSSKSGDVGDPVVVYYQPENPAKARLGGFMEQWFFPSIFGTFGLLFGGAATGIVIAAIRKHRLHAWLDRYGMRVQADLVEVTRNTSVKVKGSSPFVLRAQWQHPLKKTVHVFVSDDIWFDPTPFLRSRRQIGAQVDADRPDRYRIDLGFLPKSG